MPRIRPAFSLIELLVVLVLALVLAGLALPAVPSLRQASAQAQCQYNLKQLALATLAYHDVRGAFPTYGRPNQSWLVQIRPHLPTTCAETLHCPANRYRSPTTTSYLGVTGDRVSEGAADGDTGVVGVFPDARPVTRASIYDGASNTLLIGERPPVQAGAWGLATQRGYDSQLWMRVASRRDFGFTDCAGPATFQRPRRADAEESDGCHRYHFWSNHPDGGHFALADGSVRFFGYDAGRTILPGMATRAGGE